MLFFCFLFLCVVLFEKFGSHGDRAVSAAGTADGDGQVGFAFALGAGQVELEVVHGAIEKLGRVGMSEHEVCDRRLEPGVRGQALDEIRVWQKAHVKDDVGLDRHAVFVTKR